MTPSVRIPPVVERWDCHGCGRCCRAVIVPLSEADLARLRSQRWDQHPDFRGVRIVVRQGLGKKRYRLALGAENQCVFLTAAGRCRIHELHGEAAKPLLCRMFPLQLVPLEGYTFVTLRRHCPSAAADLGRTLEEQLAGIRQLAQQRAEEDQTPGKSDAPPPLAPRRRGSWHDFLRLAETLERLLLDQRFPLVRRLVHGLKLCDLVEQCRLQNFSGTRLDELLAMLEKSALEESQSLFDERRAPGRAGGLLFRQTALEYLRLHPDFVIQRSWRERWRLIVLAAAFTRGRGRLPAIHPCFPPATFEALEAPLGHLPAAILRPLEAYFEAAAASKQYALLSRRHWSLVENFRALALSYAVALWVVRLSCGPRPPEAEDVCGAVGAIDRGQTYDPLTGRRHRQRVASLRRLGDLPRLVAWYAR
jgi:lysine-N-methylase